MIFSAFMTLTSCFRTSKENHIHSTSLNISWHQIHSVIAVFWPMLSVLRTKWGSIHLQSMRISAASSHNYVLSTHTAVKTTAEGVSGSLWAARRRTDLHIRGVTPVWYSERRGYRSRMNPFLWLDILSRTYSMFGKSDINADSTPHCESCVLHAPPPSPPTRPLLFLPRIVIMKMLFNDQRVSV